MGLGTKIKTALNGDKAKDGPRKAKTFETKAPTPPTKTPGAFPTEEVPRSMTTNATDVNTAWKEPKPTHPQPHSTLRSPSPDYTFRTAESEAGFTDDVSQVSDFDDRTSIGETVETPLPAPKQNRLSKDPKYPYWGATGANGANGTTAAAAPTSAIGATGTGTTNSSPRSALTATMNGPNTTGAAHNDGHVKFSTAPQRHVGENDIYTGAGPVDSTYGELGMAGYDTPPSQRDTYTPRGTNATVPPPIPEKVAGRNVSGNDAYNNGYSGTTNGTGLGMTNAVDREPVLDRDTKIAEYGAPTSSETRRQASTSARGLAAAAMARRHRDDEMREYETSPTQNGYNNNNAYSQGQYAQNQPHSLNTGAYTHPETHAVGSSMPMTHERGAGVTSPTAYKHSPKDSGFGSGDDYSPASAKMIPAMNGMGDGHFGPGHQGAKVMHRCHNCGVDNDISRYFRKEVVYRLGD